MKRASLVLLLVSAACQGTDGGAPAALPSAAAGAAVVETMDSGGYTYVKLAQGDGAVWYAVPQTEVSVGDRVEVEAGAMEMRNFESRTLARTFPVIFFAGGLQQVGGE